MYAPANEYIPQCAPEEREIPRGSLFVWGALSFLTLALLGMVLAAPLLQAHGYVQAAGLIYGAYSLVCHQIGERSFHLSEHAFAVCARCTGIYAGFSVGVIFYPLIRSLKRPTSPGRIWLLAACVPIALDFSLGFMGIWPNTHFSRFATGAIFGSVCALFVVPGFIDIGNALRGAKRGSAAL